jgi:flagellar basal body-associated protein FliL
MKNRKWNIEHCTSLVKRAIFLCFSLCFSFFGYAQEIPKVAAEADTTFIKIGEQIIWTVTVETDTTDRVIFPDGQTFSPLETVEAYKTDTTRKKDRLILEKSYALTQFDSGSYKLPRQFIDINGKGFYTDSLRIDVATVTVDTLNQIMYDIKDLMVVEKSHSGWWKIVLWILLGLAILGGLLYWFVFRKKILTEEEQEALLPPYDRALLELKKLENSRYLIQDEYKKYYSELTDIVRSYLEEDVNVSALESTTDQLIDKLELMTDSGALELGKDTISQFKRILQTADLVKFAKSKPDTSVAEQDRKSIELIVVKTHDGIPEPTEEELMQQAEYLEELEQKKKKKRILIAVLSLTALLLISGIATTAYFGFQYTKDTILGHPTKVLLEGEWVRSSYGFPPVIIETPKVLVRQEIKLSTEEMATIKELQNFQYQSKVGALLISTTSISLSNPEQEPAYDQTVDQFIKSLETKGAKNIITKEEEYKTLTGVKGLKVFGSGKFKVPESKELVRGQYIVLLFGGKGFQQQIFLTWLDGDNYGQEISQRILETIEVKLEL